MNQARWTPSTNERYFQLVKDYVAPSLGRLPINQIDRAMVKKRLAELAGKKSHKTIELIHSVLSGIFSEAIEMGLIEKNPAQGLLKKLLPPEHKRIGKRPDPFLKVDLDWFLEAANEMLPAPYPLIFIIFTVLCRCLSPFLAKLWQNFLLCIVLILWYFRKNDNFFPMQTGFEHFQLQSAPVRLHRKDRCVDGRRLPPWTWFGKDALYGPRKHGMKPVAFVAPGMRETETGVYFVWMVRIFEREKPWS